MDNEFEPLTNKLKGQIINLNTTAQEEHVPEIEQKIRVVKEHARSTWNTLPFARMPHVMLQLDFSSQTGARQINLPKI